MAIEKMKSPNEIALEEAGISEEQLNALQEDTDKVLGRRAKHAGGKIGRLLIVDYPVEDRDKNDPTLIHNVFTPATEDPRFKYRLLERAKNSDEILEKFWTPYKKNGLDQYPQIAIACPHTDPYDLPGLAALSLSGEPGDLRQASNNYMLISQMIAYIVFKLPLIDRHRDPREIYGPVLSTVANLSSLYPHSDSVRDLRKRHKNTMKAINELSAELLDTDIKPKLQDMEDGSLPINTENQVWTFIAPGAAKSKLIIDQQTRKPVRLFSKPSRVNIAPFYSMHRDNVPILISGFEFSMGKTILKGFGKNVMRLGGPYVIMPPENGSESNYDQFVGRFVELLLRSGQDVSTMRATYGK